MPADFVDMVWENVSDPATQRAILALYRARTRPRSPRRAPGSSESAARRWCIWGRDDPYIPARFADEFAARLPDAEVVVLPDAGHWPWLDRADVVERTLAFLGNPAPNPASDLDSQA